MTKFFEEQTKEDIRLNSIGLPAGSAPNQIENVQSGMQDIFLSSIAWVTRRFLISPSQMPYAFRDEEHLTKFIEKPDGKGIPADPRQQMEPTRLLSYNWWRLPRVLFTKKPVFKIEDIKGTQVQDCRTPDVYQVCPGMGSGPDRIAWGEYYMALETGGRRHGRKLRREHLSMKLL